MSLVAIVTGGGTSPGGPVSIGEATSVRLARAGAKVAVADINREAAEATVRTITSEGGEAMAVIGDLSQEADAARVVGETAAWHGRLDIVVNNIGIGLGSIVTGTIEAEWDRAMAVNVKSVLFMCKHAITRMIDGGAIVNLSTTAIDTPSASAAYGATKSAVEALTKHIALQYGRRGVRCNAVRPGEVWTAMVARVFDTAEQAAAARAERRSRSALLSEGDAWDVANAVAFLASAEARWITGQVLSVDGGSALIRPNPRWREHAANGEQAGTHLR